MPAPRDPEDTGDDRWEEERHPGYDNYPPPVHHPPRPAPSGSGQAAPPPRRARQLPPLPPLKQPATGDYPGEQLAADPARPAKIPRKLTVTRVAVMRSRELTERGFATFQRAAKADGAEKSGLTALTYAVITAYAIDAAVGIALANTLFFSAATAESKTKVALYLLITIAPFAVIAPLIGPLLDRIQHGRRAALAVTFGLRTVLAIALIYNFDTWMLYPMALGLMVFNKSFAVLKSAVTPRVLPPDIDLVRTNSRLAVFGMVVGTIGAGGVAGAIALVFDSPGVLWFVAALGIAGAYLSLRIPSWVEVTEGEVPATLTYHGEPARGDGQSEAAPAKPGRRRQPLGRSVVTGLWGNGVVRVLSGFLTLYVAFVAKSTEHEAWRQAAMLGLVGAAAGAGNFLGNAVGARIKLGRPALIVVRCAAVVTAAAILAAFLNNLLGAIIVGLVVGAAYALAKVSLDASIQDDLPPESIASAFGRSETVLQLSWVLGGALGVLLPTRYWIGFTVVSVLLVAGLAQTIMSYRGHSLLPGLGGNRPVRARQSAPVRSGPFRGKAGWPAGGKRARKAEWARPSREETLR